jgi:hypothetical protein
MKMKFITFVLGMILLSTVAFLGCQKESNVKDTLSIPTPTDAKIASNLQRWTVKNDIQAMEFNGGSVETILDEIEDALNYEYGIPMQSIGETQHNEYEMTLSITDGQLTEIQAQDIYNTALNQWADTYDNFDGENKQALILSLDSEQMDNGQTKITIGTWVGETQEEGVHEPCQGNFESVPHVWAIYYKSAYPNITKYGDVEVAKAVNIKSAVKVNKCQYIASVKTITLPDFKTPPIMNETNLNDAYCYYLTEIAKALVQYPNLKFGAIKVVGDVKPNGSGIPNVLRATITLGVVKYRFPCTVPAPPRGEIGEGGN